MSMTGCRELIRLCSISLCHLSLNTFNIALPILSGRQNASVSSPYHLFHRYSLSATRHEKEKTSLCLIRNYPTQAHRRLGICFQRQVMRWLKINDLSGRRSPTRKMSCVLIAPGVSMWRTNRVGMDKNNVKLGFFRLHFWNIKMLGFTFQTRQQREISSQDLFFVHILQTPPTLPAMKIFQNIDLCTLMPSLSWNFLPRSWSDPAWLLSLQPIAVDCWWGCLWHKWMKQVQRCHIIGQFFCAHILVRNFALVSIAFRSKYTIQAGS